MTKHTILCVDDEIDNVDALERLFRKKFTVLKATSGKAALDLLDKHPDEISVIITDQRMPEMTGVELLEKSLEKHPEIVRILLTGYTDLESVILAVNKGQIFRYMTKPWDPVDLSNTVDQAITQYQLKRELQVKNKELNTALLELKSLDTAKSNFMILINHELKTPLTSIISFSSLLAESNLADEDKMMVKRIVKSSERLKNLIEDVLLIVRAETNLLKIDLQRIIFGQFDEAFTPDMRELIVKKRLKVNLNLTDTAVMADARLVRQVMLRLIHNAVKFSNEDTEVFVESIDEDSQVIFSVSNQGPHIPPAVSAKILKPFYLDEDVMHHSTGTGLGLTITQAILKAHGSKIEFENTADGVKVLFRLHKA